jgi:hypothetical protein
MTSFKLIATLAALVVVAQLGACSGGGSAAGGAAPTTATATVPPGGVNGDITLLFMGNSHTAVHDIPQSVAALVRAQRPSKTVGVANAPGSMFLEERIGHQPTLDLLGSRRWSAVVLQAQKYSASGLFTYSTHEAVELVRRARNGGATPVMFPEWPRAGIRETQTIYDLHVSIARQAAACVAPIGQAWDTAATRPQPPVLHDADGNHSTRAGAFLAALVIAATITGDSPRLMRDVPESGLDASTQAFLRAAAADAVQATSPRQWCPLDAPV